MPFFSEKDFGPIQPMPEIKFAGTTGRSATNNNPLNIEYLPGSYQDKYGAMPEPTHGGRFAKFPDMMSGYLAGLEQIRIDQARGHTLGSFVQKFSPPFQNPTMQLIADYGQAVGAGAETPLAQIPAERLIVPMLARESSTKIVGTEPQTKGQFFSEEEFNPQPQQATMPSVMPQEGIATQEPNTLMPQPNITPDQLALGKGLPSPPNVFTPQALGGAFDTAKKLLLPDWPTAGAAVGGLAGSFLGGPIGGVAGAGLGFSGTQMIQNLGKASQGEQLPPIPEQLGQYGKGFITGAAGQGFGEIIPKLLSPFAGGVAKRMAENPAVAEAQALVEKGARISPSEISDTRTARGLEWLADSVWPASAKMAKSRNSLQAVAEGLKDEFVASRNLYGMSKTSVDQAWENWVKLAGGSEAKYSMPETTRLLQDYLSKPVGKFGILWKQHVPAFLANGEASTLTSQEIDNIMAQQIQPKFKEDIFTNLKNQMLQNKAQAETGPVKYSVQDIRNLFSVLKPTSVQGAARGARMKVADAIMDDLSKSGTPEAIEALQIARESSFDNRVVAPLRNIFNQSMIAPTTAGEITQFNPSKFVNLWNQKRSIFIDNKNYSEADIAAIDKFANQMKAMIPDLKKGAEAASKPMLTMPTSAGAVANMALNSPIGVGIGIYNYPLLALPAGADWGLAKSLMNPNGIMRKFLTTGLKPPTLPAKIGLTKYIESNLLGEQP